MSIEQPQIDGERMLATGRRVVMTEATALSELAARLDRSFSQACELMLNCRGRVIVTGMGKSGHIAQKIAASLTSTGTAAHYLHPAEGVHGDLGAVHRSDLLLALSNSGETSEILGLLPPIQHLGVPVVALTGNPQSTLGRAATVVLDTGQADEADPHNLVPTTSTTVTLALGDALTVALMEARAFTPEDFAVFHPQGMLGKRLTLHVRDLLRGEETNPLVPCSAAFGAALETMTRYLLGGVSIVDEAGQLCGIITDGDVRRIIQRFTVQGGTVGEAIATPVERLMTAHPTVITDDALAYDALKVMENHQPRPIYLLPVVDQQGRPQGLLHLHALVQAGFKVTRRDE